MSYDVVMEAMKTSFVADNQEAFLSLRNGLEGLGEDPEVKDLQTLYYDVGKAYMPDSLRDWFMVNYVVFLGKFEGPRMWEIVKIMGSEKFIEEIDHRLYLIEKNGKF